MISVQALKHGVSGDQIERSNPIDGHDGGFKGRDLTMPGGCERHTHSLLVDNAY